jgi:hypothetical protein
MKLLGSAWFWVGFLATLVGLREGIDHVRQVAHKHGRATLLQMPLQSTGRVARFGRMQEIRDAVRGFESKSRAAN